MARCASNDVETRLTVYVCVCARAFVWRPYQCWGCARETVRFCFASVIKKIQDVEQV